MRRRVAVVFGTAPGVGGLGTQVANALRALSSGGDEIHAIGPAPAPQVARALNRGITWHNWDPPAAQVLAARWRTGASQYERDVACGAFAAGVVPGIAPDLCYAFTQVALETLTWAAAHDVPSILESPNGHIRAFRAVYVDEARRWCHGLYAGHPTPRMVERVEQEYAAADRIRVSSQWSRRSLESAGVPADRIGVLEQIVDTARFRPPDRREAATGLLRVAFVGSLDLRKGFVYLLEALHRLGRDRATLRIAGATGDWCSRRLFGRLSSGVDVRCAPGDPLPVLHASEVFAFPTLEDGSPFAVAEAMASGLPVITTAANGSAEWVAHDETGWIVPPRDSEAIAAALEVTLERRAQLEAMGRAARHQTVLRTVPDRLEEIRSWALGASFAF